MTLQMWRGPDGKWIEVGDSEDVGREIGCSGKTYRNYVRAKTPHNDPAPGPVTVDLVTRRHLFPMAKIRAWNGRRPGQGDHGGAGARKRWARVRAEKMAADAAAEGVEYPDQATQALVNLAKLHENDLRERGTP
jgi:hypothetical protein